MKSTWRERLKAIPFFYWLNATLKAWNTKQREMRESLDAEP